LLVGDISVALAATHRARRNHWWWATRDTRVSGSPALGCARAGCSAGRAPLTSWCRGRGGGRGRRRRRGPAARTASGSPSLGSV